MKIQSLLSSSISVAGQDGVLYRDANSGLYSIKDASNVSQVVITTGSSTSFTGAITGSQGLFTGLTGSLTSLADGRAYLDSGAGISVTTSSTGQVRITNTAINSGGSDPGAQYLVLATTASLTQERQFAPGTGLQATDGGANSTYTLAINNNVVATVSGTTFTGQINGTTASFYSFTGGSITGSHNTLNDGRSAFATVGSGLLITSASGQVVTAIDATVIPKLGSTNTFTATNTFSTITGGTASFNSFTAGAFTGSHTNLNDGRSAFIGGTGIVVTTASAQVVTSIDTAVVPRLGSTNTFTAANTFSTIAGGTASFNSFTGGSITGSHTVLNDGRSAFATVGSGLLITSASGQVVTSIDTNVIPTVANVALLTASNIFTNTNTFTAATSVSGTLGKFVSLTGSLQTLNNGQPYLVNEVSSSISLLTASSGANIGQVRIRYSNERGIDIRDFGSIVGSNFDTTIRLAITGAYQASGPAESFSGAQGAYNIYIPAGVFQLNNNIHFRGADLTGTQSYWFTPGLIGAERNATFLYWPSSMTASCISTGDQVANGGLLNYTYNQVFKNLNIRFTGGFSLAEAGFKSRSSLHQNLEDISVRGMWLSSNTQNWASGIGFDFRSNTPAPDSLHQHLRLTRCHSNFNQVGIWVDQCWSLTMRDCDVDGCAYPFWLGGAVVGTWTGGTAQSNATAPSTQHWTAGTKTPMFSTAPMFTGSSNRGGTGAILSATGSDGFTCTLSNLSSSMILGVNGAASSEIFNWVELTDPTPANPDRISGVYTVERVLSQTQILIRKGSDHAQRTNLSYRFLSSKGGNNFKWTGGIYHEGSGYEVLLTAETEGNGGSSSNYTLEHVETNNLTRIASIGRNQGKITIKSVNAGNGGMTGSIKARGCSGQIDTDTSIANIDVDYITRAGLTARAAEVGSGGRQIGGIWNVSGKSQRLNSYLRERGVFEIWDMRMTNYVTTSGGTGLTQWTGLINNTALTPIVGGQNPTYYAYDAGFGTPAVDVYHDGTNPHGLQVASPSSRGFPDWFTGATIVAVGRLPDSSSLAVAGGRRRIDFQLTDTVDGNKFIQSIIFFNDAQFQAVSGTYGFFNASHHFQGDTAGSSAVLAPPDTNAHVIVNTTGRSNTGAGCGGDQAEFKTSTAFGFNSCPEFQREKTTFAFSAARDLGGTDRPHLLLAYLAILPYGVTEQEMRDIILLAQNEFNIPENGR